MAYPPGVSDSDPHFDMPSTPCPYCSTPPSMAGPMCDCEERINCPKAGEAGHSMCGKCLTCGTPRFSGCCCPKGED